MSENQKVIWRKKWIKKNITEMKRNDRSYEDTQVIILWKYNDSYVISLNYIIIYKQLILII